MDGFIYEMPGLSRYRFNHKGQVLSLRNNRILQRQKYTRSNNYCYQLMHDRDAYTSIMCREIEAYINNLRAIEQFNSLSFHHYVYYRPVLKIYYAKYKKHATIKSN